MKKSLMAVALLSSLPAFADDWHFTAGLSEVFYKQPVDNIWYDAPYPNTRTQKNFGFQLGVEKQVLNNLTVRVGYFKPQTQTVSAVIVNDAPNFPYYCLVDCGKPGEMITHTTTQGIYFLASPEYKGLFLDAGGWLYNQTVEYMDYNVPMGPHGSIPVTGGSSHTVTAISPIVGIGFKYKNFRVALDAIYTNDPHGWPAGYRQPMRVLTITKIF